jgi:hypothetical protein
MENLLFDRPCPKCLAKKKQPCRDKAGAVIRGVHQERCLKKPREDVNQAVVPGCEDVLTASQLKSGSERITS